jgi:hypothetical protein
MIIALQYCESDMDRTMSLARLLADLQPAFRGDVLLSLVCQPDTPMTSLMEKTLVHCERKFPVEHVVSSLGAKGHPEGCTFLWAGTMKHYYDLFKRRQCQHTAIMTLDGGDGVPLHLDWLDLVLAEHASTLRSSKLITGSPYWLGGCPLHLNPNSVFEFSVLDTTAFITDIPRFDGTLLSHFDIYHRRDMVANASLSTVVHTDWQGAGNKISVDLMGERAGRSLWLHGYKDENLYWTTRQYLSSSVLVRPCLQRYDMHQLYLEESGRQRKHQTRRIVASHKD